MGKCEYCDVQTKSKMHLLANQQYESLFGKALLEIYMILETNKPVLAIGLPLGDDCNEGPYIEIPIHYCPMCGRKLGEDV